MEAKYFPSLSWAPKRPGLFENRLRLELLHNNIILQNILLLSFDYFFTQYAFVDEGHLAPPPPFYLLPSWGLFPIGVFEEETCPIQSMYDELGRDWNEWIRFWNNAWIYSSIHTGGPPNHQGAISIIISFSPALHTELFLWSICNLRQLWPPKSGWLAWTTDIRVEPRSFLQFDDWQ